MRCSCTCTGIVSVPHFLTFFSSGIRRLLGATAAVPALLGEADPALPHGGHGVPPRLGDVRRLSRQLYGVGGQAAALLDQGIPMKV